MGTKTFIVTIAQTRLNFLIIKMEHVQFIGQLPADM